MTNIIWYHVYVESIKIIEMNLKNRNILKGKERGVSRVLGLTYTHDCI